jgi:hypothetical protein
MNFWGFARLVTTVIFSQPEINYVLQQPSEAN